MGVRPHLYQMIGVNVKGIKGGEKWFEAFRQNHHETEFLTLAQQAIVTASSDEEVAEEMVEDYKERYVDEVVQVFSRNDQLFVGVLPIFQGPNQLYGHDLLYGLLETHVIEDGPKVIRVPYVNYQVFIEKTKEELNETNFSLHDKRDILDYEGVWGRKYAYQTLDSFDEDLEFAYHFFYHNGLDVKQEDIQRYLVFEWN